MWGGRASAPEELGQGADLTAYLLVLFAFRLSTVGYVVAGRELSIVFPALIRSLWVTEAPSFRAWPGPPWSRRVWCAWPWPGDPCRLSAETPRPQALHPEKAAQPTGNVAYH